MRFAARHWFLLLSLVTATVTMKAEAMNILKCLKPLGDLVGWTQRNSRPKESQDLAAPQAAAAVADIAKAPRLPAPDAPYLKAMRGRIKGAEARLGNVSEAATDAWLAAIPTTRKLAPNEDRERVVSIMKKAREETRSGEISHKTLHALRDACRSWIENGEPLEDITPYEELEAILLWIDAVENLSASVAFGKLNEVIEMAESQDRDRQHTARILQLVKELKQLNALRGDWKAEAELKRKLAEKSSKAKAKAASTAIQQTNNSEFMQAQFGMEPSILSNLDVCQKVLELEDRVAIKAQGFLIRVQEAGHGEVPTPAQIKLAAQQTWQPTNTLNGFATGMRTFYLDALDVGRLPARIEILMAPNSQLPLARRESLGRFISFFEHWGIPLTDADADLLPLVESLEKLYYPK